MATETLNRLSGMALLLGALIAALGTILLLIANTTSPLDPLIGVAGMVGLIAWPLILLGITRLYAHQARTTGVLGLIAFVLFFLAGLLLGIGQNTIFALIIPWLAGNIATRPALIAGTPALDLFFIVGELFLLVGTIFFGATTIRARVFPRWAGIVLIAGAVVRISGRALPLSEFIGGFGLVLLFVALLWLGGSLWSQRATGYIPLPGTSPQAQPGQTL